MGGRYAVFCGDVREQGTGAFLLAAHPFSAVAHPPAADRLFQQPPRGEPGGNRLTVGCDEDQANYSSSIGSG
jgi:hypothetical protein